MTFKEYVRSRRVTDTAAGDFTKDASKDGRLPDASSWSELKTYLKRRAPGGLHRDVLAAARQVWQGYQKRAHAQRS
jgi:hypothetical protein